MGKSTISTGQFSIAMWIGDHGDAQAFTQRSRDHLACAVNVQNFYPWDEMMRIGSDLYKKQKKQY